MFCVEARVVPVVLTNITRLFRLGTCTHSSVFSPSVIKKEKKFYNLHHRLPKAKREIKYVAAPAPAPASEPYYPETQANYYLENQASYYQEPRCQCQFFLRP